MTDAVLDSGPLIHLAELDALDVVCDFSSLFIPQVVRDEVGRHQPGALTHSFNLHVIAAPFPHATISILARTLSLDRGELEALSLMELYPQAIFLTDDSAARVAAEQSGFSVHGTIGILIRVVRKGHRTGPEVIDHLRSLPHRSTLHIKPSLLKEILSSLAEEWQM
jgi:predicted nucleic acid-binding protein